MSLRTKLIFYARTVLSILILLACHSTVALGVNSITGTVRNQSPGGPAAGDDVVLFRLDSGIQEEARTKTDVLGAFTLPLQYPKKSHLVRVVHQGVNYDQQASAGETLAIPVFDAAPQVRGITGSIEILRAGTNGTLLHVSDLYEINNQSSPPLTLVGKSTFEVYLPADARIDSVLAAGPGKIGEMISAAPVRGELGHYAVGFPLRPGATKFAFNYDLPYTGHTAFRTRLAYPFRQLAVMIPPNMKFSSRSPAFKMLAIGNSRYQVQTANQLAAGEGPRFDVSGAGELPPLKDQARTQTLSRSLADPNRIVPSPGHGALPSLASIDSRLKQTKSPSQSLVFGGVTSILLAACALLVWRARKTRNFFPAHSIALRNGQDNRPQPDCKP